jgi:peptidoglycan LD-endopeptidase LytH
MRPLLLIFLPLTCIVAPLTLNASSHVWYESPSLTKKIMTLGKKRTDALAVPVVGVSTSSLTDTWGESRSHGRTHEGIDIVAPKGSLILVPLRGVVVHVGNSPRGGKYVMTAHGGGERFYFAHLDRIARGIKKGKAIKEAALIGYVGNTGNASSTIPHLHFGIYDATDGASNPYPRLTKVFPAPVQKKAQDSERMKKKSTKTKTTAL